jgi:arylsulfatase A-like enzyme
MNTPLIFTQFFLRTTGIWLLTLCLPAAAQAEDSKPLRPNIVVVLADDWGWGHASVLGDTQVHTPNFDRLAKDGVLFNRSYAAAPSCTASRASLLTGQMFYRLEEAALLFGPLNQKYPTYPEILQQQGYAIGLVGKGLGPGRFRDGGREHNPAGPQVAGLDRFLSEKEKDQPFCFWFGSYNPHRPYAPQPARDPENPLQLEVPPFLPDAPEVRGDVAAYYAEVEAFDREVGAVIRTLKQHGVWENTLLLVTSDNGMPFPRAKLNLQDSGTRMPTVVHWKYGIPGNRVIEDPVSQTDWAPTFLEAAGIPLPEEMTGISLLEVLQSTQSGTTGIGPGFAVVGRERHHLSDFPGRGLHTPDYLYIRNFHPDRAPAAADPGPTLTYLMDHREEEAVRPFFELFDAPRPAEELYDNRPDPHQLRNVASDPAYADIKKELSETLDTYLQKTEDPRVTGNGELFDNYPHFHLRR